MVSCECTVHGTADVTLVEAVCTTESPAARRVTLAARVDGPVWPPRRNGVPERAWTDDEVTAVVPPDGRLAVGFATPGDPRSPPVELVDAERADPDDDAAVADATPEGVVRALGDGRPPREAVPVPGEDVPSHDEGPDPTGRHDAPPEDGRTTGEERRDAPRPGEWPDSGADEHRHGDPPPAVGAWLDAVERRLDSVEGGGPVADDPGTRGDTARKLAATAPRLRAVAERAAALAVRCDAVDTGADP